MQSMADNAWQKAADCARRAEHTYDPTVRDLYRRMGDSWIAVANRCAFLDDAVMPDSSAAERSSHSSLMSKTYLKSDDFIGRASSKHGPGESQSQPTSMHRRKSTARG
jgi:hypothetical protein